jgi:F-type H+-transporting ATPase subunit a
MEEFEKQIFYLFSEHSINIEPGAILPWFVTLIIAVPVIYHSRKLTTDCKTKGQAMLEIIYEKLVDLMCEITGKEYAEELTPILSAIFVYIFGSNVLGLIPGFQSPTSFFSNCLGMALITFIYTTYIGIKHHGLEYIKHFTGNIWWMAPIMLPIHLIGEISHPISLTLRLFGNIMGEDTVIIVLTTALCPLLLPIPMMCMAIFSGFLQALVFTILSGVYFSSALAEAH